MSTHCTTPTSALTPARSSLHHVVREPLCDARALAAHLVSSANQTFQALSLVLVRTDPECHHQTRVEALLRRPEDHYVAWSRGDVLAYLRRGDELDAVVWAEDLRMALWESEIPMTAGLACTVHLQGLIALESAASTALQKAVSLGGRLVLPHESLRAATDALAA